MEIMRRINALDGKARKSLSSPALAMAAPGAKDAILELLGIVRELAIDAANTRARVGNLLKLKGDDDECESENSRPA